MLYPWRHGMTICEEIIVTATVETTFADFDDYWTPFLSGQGPAPGYCASLAPPHLDRLRDRLRQELAPDGGPIDLMARAWAVKGTRVA